MATQILTTLTETELQELIKNAISSGIAAVSDRLKTEPEPEYLTRHETARKLKVTLPTLHKYTLTGVVKGYRISGRVLYKSNEVESSLHAMKTLK